MSDHLNLVVSVVKSLFHRAAQSFSKKGRPRARLDPSVFSFFLADLHVPFCPTLLRVASFFLHLRTLQDENLHFTWNDSIFISCVNKQFLFLFLTDTRGQPNRKLSPKRFVPPWMTRSTVFFWRKPVSTGFLKLLKNLTGTDATTCSMKMQAW